MEINKPKNIDEYIASFSKDTQEIMERLRVTIKSAAPDAVEKISYSMPTFYQNGNLVHFAAYKNHIGLYPTPSGIEAFKSDLLTYQFSKGAVQFPIDKPLPFGLITKIVKFRVIENMQKVKPKEKKVIFFATPLDFRKWLAKNHKKEAELIVGFYKVDSGKPSMTWPQSVDQALCFGWIDGIRRSIDKESYCIRSTPRRPTSIWSAINIKKVEELTIQGLMQPAGLEISKQRKEVKSMIYSFENETKMLSGELEKKFKENSMAWNFFITQAKSYQKTIIHWIMTAKQEKTQLSRLEKVISESENHKRLR